MRNYSMIFILRFLIHLADFDRRWFLISRFFHLLLHILNCLAGTNQWLRALMILLRLCCLRHLLLSLWRICAVPLRPITIRIWSLWVILLAPVVLRLDHVEFSYSCGWLLSTTHFLILLENAQPWVLFLILYRPVDLEVWLVSGRALERLFEVFQHLKSHTLSVVQALLQVSCKVHTAFGCWGILFLAIVKLELEDPWRFLKNLIFKPELFIKFSKPYNLSLLLRALNLQMVNLQYHIFIDQDKILNFGLVLGFTRTTLVFHSR